MIANATLDWHHAMAWALIVANAVAGAWALGAQQWPVLRGRPMWIVIVIAQLTAFAQAITGTILIARDDLQPARLHALYGFSAIIAVGILYSYRTSPFMKGRQYLLYGLGCLFIMGLGLRELVLA
ncbi:MAG: hypothetical protein ABW328_01200 [Ilumatobacteraceae bacterium]